VTAPRSASDLSVDQWMFAVDATTTTAPACPHVWVQCSYGPATSVDPSLFEPTSGPFCLLCGANP